MMSNLLHILGINNPADPCTIDPSGNCNNTVEGFLSTTAQNIINVLLAVAGVVAVVAIIYGGVSMMTAAGDPAKITKGKKSIFGGIIGLVLVILAGVIVNFVVANI